MTSTARAWVVTLSYLLVATLWVLFSDALLLMLELEDQQRLQTLKGIGFVLVTGALLFFFVRYHLRRRRQQEEALRLERERFDLALSGGNDGIWDWDIDNQSLYLSPRSCDILGLPTGSSPLGDWQHLLASEDRATVHAALVQHLRGATERLDVTYRLARSVHGVSWVHAGGRALRDVDGRATRLVGVLRDVSEQIAGEARLRQAGVMFDCTSEGMLICDAGQNIIDVNNAFCKITVT